jgi:hypothetical protein
MSYKMNSRMKGRSPKSKRYSKLTYVKLRCSNCGGWTNMIGAGESFEELVRLGLCAACFAERYLGTSSSRDDLLYQPAPSLVQ